MKSSCLFPIFRSLALAFVLCCLGCVSRAQSRSFTEAYRYWVDLDSVWTIETSRLAGFVEVFLNDNGIEYLLEKMHAKDLKESQIATVLLMPIYEVLLQNNSSQARRLRQVVEKSTFMEKAKEYSISGFNPAIQESLRMFLVRLETESL